MVKYIWGYTLRTLLKFPKEDSKQLRLEPMNFYLLALEGDRVSDETFSWKVVSLNLSLNLRMLRYLFGQERETILARQAF